MTHQKKVLFVRCTTDACAAEEDHLRAVCEIIGLTFESRDWVTFLASVSSNSQEDVDYLYLAAHASHDSFEADQMRLTWSDVGAILCQWNGLNPEAVVLLACCRGGLKGVAAQLFGACDHIDYVCGPRWSARDIDLATAFHVFLYNLEIRNEQPSTAARRASHAVGYDYFCHERAEWEDGQHDATYRSVPTTFADTSSSDQEPTV